MNEIEQKLWCDALLLAIGTMGLSGEKAAAFASVAVEAFRRETNRFRQQALCSK